MLDISDTAFLVNESRFRSREFSLDVYAEHWISPDRRDAVRVLWKDYSEHVYPFDDIIIGIRNRHYLNIIGEFLHNNPDGIIVNIGAGLTSYPWLINREINYTEFDLDEISRYRKQRIQRLTSEKILPYRRIDQHVTDLNNKASIEKLLSVLCDDLAISNIPSLVMLEGVTYYINPSSLNTLFQRLGECQSAGSILCFDYWSPDIVTHPVFIRQEKFFRERFGFNEGEYNLFDDTLMDDFTNYRITDSTTVVELERRYRSDSVLGNNPDNILFEKELVCIKNDSKS